MIFKTINNTISKSAYDINIKNIDLASEHWGSEKKMTDYLDTVENFTYEKETLNKNLVLHALKLYKDNIRIKDIKIYRIEEENKMILLVSSEIGKMKDFETFSREMSITFKKDKFAFSIIEILPHDVEQIKKGEKTIPANWKFDERLTGKLNVLKNYEF